MEIDTAADMAVPNTASSAHGEDQRMASRSPSPTPVGTSFAQTAPQTASTAAFAASQHSTSTSTPIVSPKSYIYGASPYYTQTSFAQVVAGPSYHSSAQTQPPHLGFHFATSSTNYQPTLPPQPYGASPYPTIHASTSFTTTASTTATSSSSASLSGGSSTSVSMDTTGNASSNKHIPVLRPYIPKPRAKTNVDLDLLSKIPGMFRLLDLCSESSSSGIVEKIIISQDSLKSFVNTVLPGAYKSVTKIDFSALDKVLVKPVGMYGSKSEIIRYLKEIGAIGDQIAKMLLVPEEQYGLIDPRLRSGIYALLPPHSLGTFDSDSSVHIIYWPEDSTWDDNATGAVRKNRVTFIRYLTRLCDQIRVLISPEHETLLALQDAGPQEDSDDEDDFAFGMPSERDADDDDAGDDRVFKFEVAKTKEQEENAHITPGFSLVHHGLSVSVESLSPPTFLSGETAFGFISSTLIPAVIKRRELNDWMWSTALKSELKRYSTIVVEESVSDAGFMELLTAGDLKTRLSSIFTSYQKQKSDTEASFTSQERLEIAKGLSTIKDNMDVLKSEAKYILAQRIVLTYGMFTAEDLMDDTGSSNGFPMVETLPTAHLDHICVTNSEVQRVVESAKLAVPIKEIKQRAFQTLRNKFLAVRGGLEGKDAPSPADTEQLVKTILDDKAAPSGASSKLGWLKSVAKTLTFGYLASDEESVLRYISHERAKGDAELLTNLPSIVNAEPTYAEVATRMHDLARLALRQELKERAATLAGKIRDIQERTNSSLVRQSTNAQKAVILKDIAANFRSEAVQALRVPSSGLTLVVTSAHCVQGYRDSGRTKLVAYCDEQTEPVVQHRLWSLGLTEQDRQKIKENSTYVPTPRPSRQPEASFTFTPSWKIRHAHLLSSNKCLLIADRPGGAAIWLFSLHSGFSTNTPSRSLASSPGRRYVFAVDEQTRVIAVVTMERGRCDVQQFAMDESQVHSRGSPFSLNRWYPGGTPNIISATFFCGTDELCLMEDTGRIRVFSFLSQTVRPAALQLSGQPMSIHGAPDGSALIVIEHSPTTTQKRVRVLHRASFGKTNDGIVRDLPDSFGTASTFSVTSFDQRGNIHLSALHPSHGSITSAVISISKKETEYLFRMKDDSSHVNRTSSPSVHNCLVNCFSDVWGRYPVVPAVQRDVISPDTRDVPSVQFVCSTASRIFRRYFKRMIQDFERVTRKPTGRKLEEIRIEALEFDDLTWNHPSASIFKAGEWLVELLCLIPIHIAVTRENRFVPLKDGVLDRELEQKLLGADVTQIIDAISLGWYESIFASYMASKPVKVISSMGEQSVGKSYSLNHIVDSSFAGSAVRTTEGVWLSVCPTESHVIVALDFEGVHSIERTAQEDMLLVLFNTALSNLVLFRNNFALSRDVANMFTSFQASTHLFDPAANPKLFKGLLAIVIKDVVDGDKKEIVKEFQSKFHQIVANEQAANFISVLHNSQLTVIPWSVIQSREFYTLFTKLNKLLMAQKTTHASAGEFLITLKTLMAKMKAQDWGSIDQTAIKHRTSMLASVLATAFTYGRSEADDNGEELKNLDNQDIVHHPDTGTKFSVAKDAAEIQAVLQHNVVRWIAEHGYDLDALKTHLTSAASLRIQHVQGWLEVNTSRFPNDNSDIRSLRRAFDDTAETLKSNLLLCLADCSDCRLQCLLPRSHSSGKHTCMTDHRCHDDCSYLDDHDDIEACGLPAGHEGRHLCNPDHHVCGHPCHLDGKKGCQKTCILPADHMDDDHVCSARTHQCSEPCDVQNMAISAQRFFTCDGVCSLAYDVPHEQHSCDNRTTCPVRCSLCQRYCALGDHFHGFETGAIHLCGQEHPCTHDCEAAGICEINTTPQSVETTFSGRHETFQYTKYTQAARRLPCAVTIPPGEMDHDGRHLHDENPDAFHYCEEACRNCGYICTLPLGHQQADHDTAHGSMEQTIWAIEGNPDATIEVQGRRFGAQDGGAPQLCSSICQVLGRHAHIDYCRNGKGVCQEPESDHINEVMLPNPDRPKDWVSHKVFWARSRFIDPYSRDEKAEFALCDVQCAGPEHQTAGGTPSFCTLPIFHPPQPVSFQVAGNASYVSNDGHEFGCPNPNNLRQAYHVIFALDKSGSMWSGDRRPLQNQPSTALISQYNDNRFGAVLSAVYQFWLSRGSGTNRRDAYSVITFDGSAQVQFTNDFNSDPDQLLARLVRVTAGGGTYFDGALRSAQTVMETNWSTDRSPVIIFLSDGECSVSDNVIFDICNRAVALGKALSFHAVSFGTAAYSSSLRRMVTIAEQVAQSAPRDPLAPLVPCSFAEAMDSIRLAETFLAIADSMKKPRASLIQS